MSSVTSRVNCCMPLQFSRRSRANKSLKWPMHWISTPAQSDTHTRSCIYWDNQVKQSKQQLEVTSALNLNTCNITQTLDQVFIQKTRWSKMNNDLNWPRHWISTPAQSDTHTRSCIYWDNQVKQSNRHLIKYSFRKLGEAKRTTTWTDQGTESQHLHNQKNSLKWPLHWTSTPAWSDNSLTGPMHCI